MTRRFHEVDLYLSAIVSMESKRPSVTPDSMEVRIMRGLFYVHLYGALEYAIDKAFIRLAQVLSDYSVEARHLETVLFSVAMEKSFESLRQLNDFDRKFGRRVEMIEAMDASTHISVPDTVLSDGMQSLTKSVITTAFKVYGIQGSPLVDLPAGTYMDDVFRGRCAVAHGRESPVVVGIRRSDELRVRYNALYRQASYVLDRLEEVIASRKFVRAQHRSRYPA